MENYARFRKETEKRLNAVYQKHFGRSAYGGPAKIKKGAKGRK
jgi:hypothetical protein